MDLADVNDAKLQALLDACDRAPVLDGTSPKAWKMDASKFSPRLDIVYAGIVEHVNH